MQETHVRSLGREDPLEEGMATHSSILAWSIPRTEEPGGLQSMGWQRVVISKEKPCQVPRFGISEGKHRGTPCNAAAAAESLQSCPTLCDPIDGSPPGSFLHRICQARIPEGVAIFFSRGSSRPRDRTCVSCTGRWILYH